MAHCEKCGKVGRPAIMGHVFQNGDVAIVGILVGDERIPAAWCAPCVARYPQIQRGVHKMLPGSDWRYVTCACGWASAHDAAGTAEAHWTAHSQGKELPAAVATRVRVS